MPPDKKKKRGKKNWNLIYQFMIYQLIDARSGAQVSKLGIVMPNPIVIPRGARNLFLLGIAKMPRESGDVLKLLQWQKLNCAF
jgi:hypothetical protein